MKDVSKDFARIVLYITMIYLILMHMYELTFLLVFYLLT